MDWQRAGLCVCGLPYVIVLPLRVEVFDRLEE